MLFRVGFSVACFVLIAIFMYASKRFFVIRDRDYRSTAKH